MDRATAERRPAHPGIDVCVDRTDGGPFDIAVSRAMLDAVARGERGEVLRIYDAADVVAFSATDRHRPGFEAAVAAAAELGFGATLRLAGGSAALFQRESLAFAWCLPSRDARAGVHRRFAAVAAWIAAALQRVGVDAQVGEVPGEYCPGEYSVNARGTVKLAGIGQRLVRGAAHVGGVITIDRSDRTRRVLGAVYGALDLPFAPDTAGAVRDEASGARQPAVRDALLAELALRRTVRPVALDADTRRAAEDWRAHHSVGGRGTAGSGAPETRTEPGSPKTLAEQDPASDAG